MFIPHRANPYLPSTYADVIARFLKGCRTILDLGCGRGEVMYKLRNRGVVAHCIGLDIWAPYLSEAKKKRTHHAYILADSKYLPFRPKSFDAVLSSQLIEHLEKLIGLKVLLELEDIASKKIVIGTPAGLQDPTDPDTSYVRYQKHKTGYLPLDLANLGYEVVGQGLGIIYRSPNGLMHKMPKLKPILIVISYGLFPITYLLPYFAAQMIAVKTMRK